MWNGYDLAPVDDISLTPESVDAAEKVAEEGNQKADMDNLGVEASPGPPVSYYVKEALHGTEDGIEGEESNEDDEEVYPEGLVEIALPGRGKPLKEDGRLAAISVLL